MVNLIQIFAWFKDGLYVNEDKFKQTWQSFWHKSEKLPISQILGLKEEIAKSTTNFKGYHTSLAELLVAYPQADNKKDFFAWVGSPYPGTVYKAFANGGAWTNTGEVPTQEEIDLAEYLKKDALTGTITDESHTAPSNHAVKQFKDQLYGSTISSENIIPLNALASVVGGGGKDTPMYYMNQGAIRGKSLDKIEVNITTVGEVLVFVGKNVNSAIFTQTLLKTETVNKTGIVEISLDGYVLKSDEWLGFASLAQFKYDNTKTNSVGGGFYAKTESGWVTRNHNLNISVWVGEIVGGDILDIKNRLEVLETGGVLKEIELTVNDFTEKDVRGTDGQLHQEWWDAWKSTPMYSTKDLKSIDVQQMFLNPQVYSISYYDSNKNFIPNEGLTNTETSTDKEFSGVIEPIENASYVVFAGQVRKGAALKLIYKGDSEPVESNNDVTDIDYAIFKSLFPSINWCAVGDSLTYLNDHTDETGNRVEKGYLTRTVERLPNLTYNNIGDNGSTTGSWLGKNIPFADLYTVLLSTNDWYNNYPLGSVSDFTNASQGTILGNLGVIKNKILTANSNAKIIFLTPVERTDFIYHANFSNNKFGSYKANGAGVYLKNVASAIVSACEANGYACLDLNKLSKITPGNAVRYKRLKVNNEYQNILYPNYIGLPFNPSTDEYPYPIDAIATTYDGLHLSDVGNDIVASLLVNAIVKLYLNI